LGSAAADYALAEVSSVGAAGGSTPVGNRRPIAQDTHRGKVDHDPSGYEHHVPEIIAPVVRACRKRFRGDGAGGEHTRVGRVGQVLAVAAGSRGAGRNVRIVMLRTGAGRNR